VATHLDLVQKQGLRVRPERVYMSLKLARVGTGKGMEDGAHTLNKR